ncbi:MMPL family protein [Streptomyces noursei ATCC 11455]|uniref:MMPL family transporter n=1 Tax=Streptomyces noursei TaxID=1971 RepID=UPI00081C3AA1|nr:MMPL family protein [Streptomyces noursei ATCC 11455]
MGGGVTAFSRSDQQARDLVREIRALPGPGPGPVLVGGETAAMIDEEQTIGRMLGLVAVLIVGATAVALWCFTRSLVILLKALIMNALSFGAAFGIAVWVFQEGHLHGQRGHGADDCCVGERSPVDLRRWRSMTGGACCVGDR